MWSADFDLAALAVFNRLRDNGSALSMDAVRDVIAELGSGASPGAVHRQVQQWVTSGS